jgi:hypothetical protein
VLTLLPFVALAVAVNESGIDGIVNHVPFRFADAGLFPVLFAATTVIEYSVPLSRVVNGQVSADVEVHVLFTPPAVAVTVYVSTPPPNREGADQLTVKPDTPFVILVIDGADGGAFVITN